MIFFLYKFIKRLTKLTKVAEEDREEYKSMGGTKHHYSQVHAEVEDLEELRLGEVQHDNTKQLGQRDTAQNLKQSGAIE